MEHKQREFKMLRTLVIITCYLALVDSTVTGHSFVHGFQDRDKVVPYRIRSNEVYHKRRSIDIVIDEKDFGAENLKLLMNHLFRAYPTPELLSVFVATNISQFDLAEYVDPSKRPGALYPYGGLYRDKDREYIRYKFPNNQLQTIIIKSKRTARNGKPQ